MYLSKSSLNSFLQCPYKFQKLYREKIKVETSPQAQRGIDVHDFCAKFYDHLTFKNKHFEVDPNFVKEFTAKCSLEAIVCINNFIAFEKQRWEVCRELCPTSPKKLFIPLLRESKLSSDSLEQVTIIDRLDLRLDGKYTLVEIKTEKYQPKEWKKTEFRREMCFEKSTIENSEEFRKTFKDEVVDFVIYFPRSNDIMFENYNWRSMSALKRAIEACRAAVKAESYPCYVDYHCRWCPFNLGDCPMSMEE